MILLVFLAGALVLLVGIIVGASIAFAAINKTQTDDKD